MWRAFVPQRSQFLTPAASISITCSVPIREPPFSCEEERQGIAAHRRARQHLASTCSCTSFETSASSVRRHAAAAHPNLLPARGAARDAGGLLDHRLILRVCVDLRHCLDGYVLDELERLLAIVSCRPERPVAEWASVCGVRSFWLPKLCRRGCAPRWGVSRLPTVLDATI